MSSSSAVTKERFLVSKGDNGVLSAGIKVISCPSGNCAKGQGIVFPAEALPGMFVWYKSTDYLSVDPSSSTTGAPFVFGMFNDKNGDGVVNEIIKVAGDKVGCDFEYLRGSAPIYPRPELSRFLFTCTSKDTLYAFKVYLESDLTRKQFYQNRGIEYPVQYMNPPGACDSCDDTDTCIATRNGLVDYLNNLGGSGAPLWPKVKNEPVPVKAYVQHETDNTFTLDGVANSCSTCGSFTGIKGIKIQGTSYTFSNTYNSVTSVSNQLETLIENINCSFPKNAGFAYLGKQTLTSTCPQIDIVINTGLEVELIRYDNAVIAPTSTAAIDFKGFSCSIAFVGIVGKENCNCETISDDPVRYYPTHVDVSSIEGFTDAIFEKCQTAVQPINLGVQLWQQEFDADPRPGFGVEQYRTGGRYNNFLDIARSKGVLTDCNDVYCVVSWGSYFGGLKPHIGTTAGVIVGNVVAIPHSSTVTKAALLADINALKNAGDSAFLSDVNCTVDADPGPPSPSPSKSNYATPTVTPSRTVTPTVTKSISITPSITPTRTVTPTVTSTPSRSA